MICGEKEVLETEFNTSDFNIPNDCPSRFFKQSKNLINKVWRNEVQDFWNDLNKNTL